jgi:hypothetical protein
MMQGMALLQFLAPGRLWPQLLMPRTLLLPVLVALAL